MLGMIELRFRETRVDMMVNTYNDTKLYNIQFYVK